MEEIAIVASSLGVNNVDPRLGEMSRRLEYPVMRRHPFLAVTAVSFALLLAIVSLFQRASHSQQVSDDPKLRVLSAEAFDPKEKQPRGIRLTAVVNLSALKVGEKQFEIDVRLDKRIAEGFAVVDATVWTNEKDRQLPDPSLQPFYNDAPPEGVDARWLLPASHLEKYSVDIYLAPKDGKADPELGLEYLRSPDDLGRNVRLDLVERK